MKSTASEYKDDLLHIAIVLIATIKHLVTAAMGLTVMHNLWATKVVVFTTCMPMIFVQRIGNDSDVTGLQEDIDAISLWVGHYGLVLNPTKTNLLTSLTVKLSLPLNSP